MDGRRALGTALAGTSGLAMALQSRVNGELAIRLGDGVGAALISFAAGLALLAPVTMATPAGRRGLRAIRRAVRAGTLPWWHCLGGVCGGIVVATQGLTVATLGVAVFTVALVAGQSVSSLAVDRTGLVPGGAKPATPLRMVGAALCVVAVIVAVADRLGAPRELVLAVLPLLAATGIAWQQAVNGRVRDVAGSAWHATLVNFVTGTATLLVGFAIVVLARGWPDGALPAEPYLYSGGVLGMVIIATAAAVVRMTGVLLLGLAATAGQLVGALLLDLLVPTAGPPAVNTYAGVALALLAVATAVAPRRRARADRQAAMKGAG